MKSTFYKNLCIKELTNRISDNEKKLLIDWLDKSATNKLEYEKIQSVWKLTAPQKLDYDLDIDEQWQNLKDNIEREKNNYNEKKWVISDFINSLFAPRFRPIWAMGSVLLIVLSAIIFFNNYESPKIIKTITTSNNQRLEVTLSDGSVVQLNNDSEIQYFENFSQDKRVVKLKGEAFFSVKKDGRPFIISTENATTTVLGTKFNVWSREDETRVFVKEGSVSLADKNESRTEVILSRGELSKIVEAFPPEKPIKVDTEYMLGWLSGKLVFNNTSLFEITKELERAYDVKVSLANNDLLEYNLTGSFDNEKIDTVLTKICLALNLKYVESNNKYRITK